MVLRKLSQSLQITIALVVSVFSTGLLPTTVAYATNTSTRTNAGDTKVVDELGGSEVPNNEPILSDCDLGIEFYNFVNTADETASVVFEPQAPTDDVQITVTGNQSPIVPGDGDADGDGNNDLDGAHPYSLSFVGSPKTQGNITGYHVKVSTDVTNTNGGAKTKVFWMPASCGPTTPESDEVSPAVPTITDLCGLRQDSFVQPDDSDEITYSTAGNVVTATLVNPETHDFGAPLNDYVVATDGLTAAYTVVFTNSPCISPTICENPDDGGIITQNSADWATTGDAEFVDGAVSIDSNNWVDGGVVYTETYKLADVQNLDWTLDTSSVTGAYGVGILLETEDGDVIHYEPATVYTDDFWSNTAVLPANGGGEGGPYSGSLQDALDTIGNLNIVKTTFVFTSAQANENLLLTSLSFNCKTYTFDKAEVIADANRGLCHATGNGGYVLIENISSAGIYNGHYGSSHHDGRDIIPTFTYNGTEYSQNWDTPEQKAIYDAGCKVATICTVSNNTYLAPWTFGGDTYPEAGDGGSYSFKADGLHLSTPTVDAWVYGLTSAGNTPLNDVDAMSYKTLRKAESAGFGSTAPAYILQIDTNGLATAGGTKYYFYEPYYNSPPAVQEGIWQTWDTLDSGDAQWWTGPSQTLSSWSSIVAAYPDGVVTAYGFNQGSYNAETYSAVQDITFDCATTHFGVPGQGGGEVLGDQTGGGQGGGKILGTVLPAMLPSTGGNDSPFMVIIASLLAYGAAYFLQGRRLLGRNESLRV